MSDDERNSDDLPLNGNSGSDNICRDFLRNVCRRGSSCKFKHLEGNEGDQFGKKMDFVFCHDYQNRECHRINCKFMHCTRQEEQHYRATGELPKNCMDSSGSGKAMSSDGRGMGRNDTPVCKDYLKGDCRRGTRCKFRHVSNNDYEMDNGRGRRDRFDQFDSFDSFDFEPEAKRRAFDEPFHPSIMDRGGMGLGAGGSLGGMGMPPPFHNFRMLEEENILLRRKVEELKKQIADLTATNEFLLDQNAQLRLTKQSSVSHSMASMSQMPMNNNELGVPVTLGQGMSATMSMGQGMQPASLAQSMMTMSSPSTNLVSYPIMTQSMRPIIPHGMGH